MTNLKQKRDKKGRYGRKTWRQRLNNKEIRNVTLLACLVFWTVNVIDWQTAEPVKWVIVQAAEGSATRLDERTIPLDQHQIAEPGLSNDDTGVAIQEAGATPNRSTPASVDGILQKVGVEEGVDWKLLKAICLTESGCKNPDCSIKGNCDNGDSWGAFQINKPAHPTLTLDQATDFEWASRWTAKHGKAYANDPALFCKNHNGIKKTTNQWYIDRCLNKYQNI